MLHQLRLHVLFIFSSPSEFIDDFTCRSNFQLKGGLTLVFLEYSSLFFSFICYASIILDFWLNAWWFFSILFFNRRFVFYAYFWYKITLKYNLKLYQVNMFKCLFLSLHELIFLATFVLDKKKLYWVLLLKLYIE